MEAEANTVGSIVEELQCPHDGSRLMREPGALVCPSCRTRYAASGNVIDFMAEDDPFYEGAFNNEVRYLPKSPKLIHQLPLWLITNGYLWTVRKMIRPGSRVLELGCAGGVAWFGSRYRMIGVDVSRQGLALASRKYELCLRSSTLRAVPDASVDAVVSSYFWEHIRPADKEVLAGELARILRPGGRIVFVYDIATENPLIAWMRKRDPRLYQRMFLDGDGHVGYQPIADNESVFRTRGLRLLLSRTMERTPLQSTSVYLKMQSWSGAVRAIGLAMSGLDRRPLSIAYMALLRLVDDSIGRLFPRDWGRIAITVAEKP
jgi:SAM-dependent methyltransferase